MEACKEMTKLSNELKMNPSTDSVLRQSFAKIFHITETDKEITQLSIEIKINISTDSSFCKKSFVTVFHMSPPPRNTANCPIPI